jgi:hypothetical protein
MLSRRLFIATAFLLAFTGAASAQQPGPTPAEREAFTRDAFASAYGKANIAELGKALRADADPACLSSKGLQAAALEARGRDLFINWTNTLSERMNALYDPKVYGELFTASAEFDRLKQHADVKRYMALSAPARQVKLIDSMTENFARYMLINKIKLRFASALETANPAILSKDPTEAAEAAAEKFVASRKSPALNRFLNLSDQANAAMTESIDKEQAKKTLPHNFLKGIEADLAELCIGKRS